MNSLSKKQFSIRGLRTFFVTFFTVSFVGLTVMAYPNVGDKATFDIIVRLNSTFTYSYFDDGPANSHPGDQRIGTRCGINISRYLETQELTAYDSVTDTFDMKIDRKCKGLAGGMSFVRKVKRNDLFTPEKAQQWIQNCLEMGGEMTPWGLNGMLINTCLWKRESGFGKHLNGIADMPFAWVTHEDYWGSTFTQSRRIR
jgi:hypothetical protein